MIPAGAIERVEITSDRPIKAGEVFYDDHGEEMLVLWAVHDGEERWELGVQRPVGDMS